jgi:TonB-linked SusC/RagA family outer membrane protein
MKHSDYHGKLLRLAMFFVALFLCGTMAYAQTDRLISGIVVDENGDPLPAAHIRQVSQTKGEELAAVITDMNGHFRLTLLRTAKEIEISYLGYESKKVRLTSANSYRIVLEPASELLDEVVVTGYQTISRERATGSFAKVDSKKLETQRLSSVSSLMEGRIAGYSDGKIRGVTSMNGLTTPLYVIDGFPVEKTISDGLGNWVENVPDLNIEDIENITVLKDAAATSIYGARAANGVVVITTKKAGKNQLNVSFSATLTVRPYNFYTGHLADTADMIEMEKEWAAMNPNLQGEGASQYAQNLLDNASMYSCLGVQAILKHHTGAISEAQMEQTLHELASQGFRYYDDVKKYGKRNPFSQQYNLNIGRGTEKNTFNASLSYRNNREEDKYTDSESFGLNLQNTTRLTSWLSLDLGTYLNYGDGTTQSYNLTSPGYNYVPYSSLLNDDGSYYTNTAADRYSKSQQEIISSYGLYSMDITPLDELGRNLSKSKNFSNRTFARLNFKFTDWLRYTASFQYEVGEYKTSQLQDKESYAVRNKVNTFATDASGSGQATYNLPYGNIYTTGTNSIRAYNFRQQLDFNKTFAEKHDVTALFGMEVRENKTEYNNRKYYNYDPALLTYDLIDERVLSNTYTGVLGNYVSFNKNDISNIYELVNRFVSFYGNAAYTYDGKYMVTGSIRWDRTNLFATGSKYQKKPIWSVGAGWNLDKESFFKVSFINMMKLRFSYGNGGPKREQIWKQSSKNFNVADVTTTTDGNKTVLTVNYLLAAGNLYIMKYTIYPDGVVHAGITFTSTDMKAADTEVSEATLMATFTPGQDAQRLASSKLNVPRIGVRFHLPSDMNQVEYFGRGPGENYIDRNASSFVDLYRTTADQMYTNNYVRPQENGHRTDTRWVELTHKGGKGLLIRADSTIGFNALRNSVEDFDSEEAISRPRQWTNFTPEEVANHNEEKAKNVIRRMTHVNDITPRNFVEVCIDMKQQGIAGYDSWGDRPLPEHTLPANKEYHWGFTLMPVK